jgi:hypothetical protein
MQMRVVCPTHEEAEAARDLVAAGRGGGRAASFVRDDRIVSPTGGAEGFDFLGVHQGCCLLCLRVKTHVSATGEIADAE